ncbi:MAG: S-layer homology domain-containing protein [Nitriliruptorales bacterium]
MNSAWHRANVLGDNDLVAAGADVSNGRLWVTANFIRGPKSGLPLFRDIGGSAHESQVGAVWLADVASGCRFAVFCGDAAVTRAQMATFLARAGLEPVGGQRFSDVAPGAPHAGHINATAAARITSGCDSGGRRFCPGAPVTRDQMATFLARAFRLSGSFWRATPTTMSPTPAPY